MMRRTLINFAKKHSSQEINAIGRFVIDSARKPSAIKKHWNKMKWEWTQTKKESIGYTPPVFICSVTLNCNLRCPTCLYLLENKAALDQNTRYISPEKFEEILTQFDATRKTDTIFLTGGEFLLHPDLAEIIRIAKSHKLNINGSTNGLLLKDKLEEIKKLDYVNISADAYDFDSYSKYRGATKKQFDNLLAGLSEVSKTDLRYSISFLLSKSNIGEVDKMIEFASQFSPSQIYFHNINPHGCDSDVKPLFRKDPDTEAFLEYLLAKNDYVCDISLPHIFDPDSPTFEKAICHQPWQYFCFDNNGDVAFCCHLKHQKNIGNIFDGYDFNSKVMKNFRKSMISGKIPDSCLYCQRRFMGMELGRFDHKKKRWYCL